MLIWKKQKMCKIYISEWHQVVNKGLHNFVFQLVACMLKPERHSTKASKGMCALKWKGSNFSSQKSAARI